MQTALWEQARVSLGRESTPSAVIIESHSVKTRHKGGARGSDGGTNVKGRTRQILVETTGTILSVLVHEADIQDHEGGTLLLAPRNGRVPMTFFWPVHPSCINVCMLFALPVLVLVLPGMRREGLMSSAVLQRAYLI